jgi:glycosyltransferase 2 family protein
MKQFFAFAGKSVISVLLLYLALRWVDVSSVKQRLDHIDWTWSLAALLTLAAQFALVSVRWQRIAADCSSPLTSSQALLYTFIGAFFNQTLPSTIGGDAARVWLQGSTAGRWKGAVYSVLIDRAAGLLWLTLIVLACLPWSLRLISNPAARATLIVIGLLGIAGPVALFAITRLGRAFSARWRVIRLLTEISDTTWKVLFTPATGGLVAAISIGVHLMTVLAIWFAAQAIGSRLGPETALFLIPPVILISTIPISIAGWGVREGAMIAAFAYAGLPDTDGLAISVLFGVGLFVIGAVGGVAWIVSGRRVSLAVPLLGAEPPSRV